MFFESPLQKYGAGILFPKELLSNKPKAKKTMMNSMSILIVQIQRKMMKIKKI